MPDAPLRLGVITLPNVSWPRLVQQWQRLEELGYDSVWDCDHFVNPYAPTSSGSKVPTDHPV